MQRGGGDGDGGSANLSKKLMPLIRSAREIEDGISSTSTVKWDPFTVFPKEIYLEIFNKLDIPTKHNFINAHVKFYDLLRAERVKFLFGKVIDDLSLNEEEEMTDFLIGLRLVCRGWDQGIQNYYQRHPDHFQFSFLKDEWGNDLNHLKKQYATGYLIRLDCFPRPRERNMLANRNLETDMSKFLESHPSKNPFLTRKITVEILWPGLVPNDECFWKLWSQVDTLLENYGRHIWHFCFRLNYSELSPEIHSRLLGWLRLMPELQTVQLLLDSDFPVSCGRREFDSIIQTESLPMLKLQNFHVFNFPPFAFNKLLEEIKAVEKVEVDIPPQLWGIQLPARLTELSLKVRGYDDVEYLNKLEPFPVMRNLVINIISPSKSTGDTDPKLKYSDVWKAIEEKFPALEDLHIDLCLPNVFRNKMVEESLDCRLNLKKLKRLSLTLPISSSLDFLQEIETLQELKVKIFKDNNFWGFGADDLVRRERVQFNRDFATMWVSNIWEIFPNLKKLSISEPKWPRKGEIHYFYEKWIDGKKMYNKIFT